MSSSSELTINNAVRSPGSPARNPIPKAPLFQNGCLEAYQRITKNAPLPVTLQQIQQIANFTINEYQSNSAHINIPKADAPTLPKMHLFEHNGPTSRNNDMTTYVKLFKEPKESGLDKNFTPALSLILSTTQPPFLEWVARLRKNRERDMSSFRTEVTILKYFQGKPESHICQMRDYHIYKGKDNVEKGVLYMDLYDGTLLNYFDLFISKMDEGKRRSHLLILAHQMLYGLLQIHKLGYKHSDLKLENIYYKYNKEKGTVDIFIGDFGLAIFIGDFGLAGKIKAPGGSPHYRAPERLTSDLAYPTADIWAIGLMLYELYTGNVPIFHKLLRYLRLIDKAKNQIQSKENKESKEEHKKRSESSSSQPQTSESSSQGNPNLSDEIKQFNKLIDDLNPVDLAQLFTEKPKLRDHLEFIRSKLDQLLPKISVLPKVQGEKLLDELTRLIYTKLQSAWSVQTSPEENNPLKHLIWALLRPNMQERIAVKQAIDYITSLEATE